MPDELMGVGYVFGNKRTGRIWETPIRPDYVMSRVGIPHGQLTLLLLFNFLSELNLFFVSLQKVSKR